MALLEDKTAVFIVRIWCERGDTQNPVAEWRGSVEHVQTGQKTFFRHLELILEFMKPHLRAIGIDAEQRFWERISSVMDADEGDAQIEVDLGSDPVAEAPLRSTARKSR